MTKIICTSLSLQSVFLYLLQLHTQCEHVMYFEFRMNDQCLQVLDHVAIVLILTDESRLTVMSHEAKKKQRASASSGLHDYYSELFTWMAALKF